MELIPGDTKGESRLRTYKECELNLMFTMIKDDAMNYGTIQKNTLVISSNQKFEDWASRMPDFTI